MILFEPAAGPAEPAPHSLNEWRVFGRKNAREAETWPTTGYQPGVSQKCRGCNGWHPRRHMRACSVSKFTRAELDRHFAWSREREREDPDEVSMCRNCVVDCVRCDDTYHRENAKAYGICFDCHRALQ